MQREDKYQWYLNAHEEYLDLYIYENIYKDYNEKIDQSQDCPDGTSKFIKDI